MVAALLRWRQSGYQVARRGAVWGGILEDLDLFGRELVVDRELALQLGRGLVAGITINPSDVIGPPKELFTPGRAMGLDGRAATLVAKGFGIDARLDRPATEVVGVLRGLEVPRQPLVDLTKVGGLRTVGGAIGAVREIGLEQQVAGSISEVILGRPGGGLGGIGAPIGGGIFGGVPVLPHGERREDGPDALDEALARHPGAADEEVSES